METFVLWTLTQESLCNQEWSMARSRLDRLGQRNDNRDMLCDADMYGCPKDIHDVIQDRIDLVNSHVR